MLLSSALTVTVWLLESKSLELYLQSFRNHGAFHEDCTIAIGKRIVGSIEPKWLRIAGFWFPRGGVRSDVFWQTGAPLNQVGLPDRACRLTDAVSDRSERLPEARKIGGKKITFA